jgi:hypothetical protein
MRTAVLIGGNRVGVLDRRTVRARFEERFSARRIAEDYVRNYKALATPPIAERERYLKWSPTTWNASLSPPALNTPRSDSMRRAGKRAMQHSQLPTWAHSFRVANSVLKA